MDLFLPVYVSPGLFIYNRSGHPLHPPFRVPIPCRSARVLHLFRIYTRRHHMPFPHLIFLHRTTCLLTQISLVCSTFFLFLLPVSNSSLSPLRTLPPSPHPSNAQHVFLSLSSGVSVPIYPLQSFTRSTSRQRHRSRPRRCKVTYSATPSVPRVPDLAWIETLMLTHVPPIRRRNDHDLLLVKCLWCACVIYGK